MVPDTVLNSKESNAWEIQLSIFLISEIQLSMEKIILLSFQWFYPTDRISMRELSGSGMT